MRNSSTAERAGVPGRTTVLFVQSHTPQPQRSVPSSTSIRASLTDSILVHQLYTSAGGFR